MRKLVIALCLLVLIPACALAQEGLWFSHESGFYDGPIEVEIFCDDPEADIYYTLDGTVPTEEGETSFYYDGAFYLEDRTDEPNELSAIRGITYADYSPMENITKAHVIRAWAVYPNGQETEVINGTFFVDVDRQKLYGDVPVISLMMDPEDLFDYETGIYVLGQHWAEWHSQQLVPYENWQIQGNFSLKGMEWERPITVQYLAADGTVGFTQDMGVRIKGGVSRYFNQKSFRLIARDQYGKKNLEYPILGDNPRADGNGQVEKYKSITLRNGGNDGETTRLRDPLFQRLGEGLDYMTQASVPCVVFLNGEYWGMYNITEEYSDHAVQNNYGVPDENVIVFKNGRLEDGVESDVELFEEMFDFIAYGDMTNEDNYHKACEMLDLPAFAQYCALHLFVNNTDSIFQNNNWMIWRARETSGDPYCDGQWRFLLFDTEQGADIWGDGRNFTVDNITPAITAPSPDVEERHPQRMFYSLYQNEAFRKEFVLAMCDMRNINFNATRMEQTLKEMRPVYEHLMRDTYLRFGPDWIVLWNLDTYQKDKLEQLATYLRGRYNRLPNLLQQVFSYKAPVEATVTVSDEALGSVQVNRTRIPQTDYTGMYFTEHPITLTAIPAEGHTFKGWTADGATLDDPSATTVTVSFTQAFSVQAIFE